LREEAEVHRSSEARYQPRLHDFRHSFALVRIVTWYREGKNVQRLLPHLTTYLGHGSIQDTAQYDQLAAIVDLCAWAHAEWVRIHPFANGNGRTARLWANCLAMRYGLPPFIRLRPRPNSGYAAAAKAMHGRGVMNDMPEITIRLVLPIIAFVRNQFAPS
jgi:hypothetical protein